MLKVNYLVFESIFLIYLFYVRQKDDRRFEEDFYEEELVILESSVRIDLKVLGRNESPGVDGIPK